MRALIITFIFISNLYAQELFVSYLKPFEKNNTAKVKRTVKRDPMEEPLPLYNLKVQKKESPQKRLELKAILYNPTSKKAFINNELFSEGEVIEGYKIKKILPYGVVIVKENKEYTLKIDEGGEQ